MVLPYLEQKELYDRIDFSVSWDASGNTVPFQTIVEGYRRPGIAEVKDGAGYALSDYAGNVLMLGGAPRRLGNVIDGTANTLMAGEVNSGFKPWGDPTNWRDPALGINRAPDGFGSPFKGGANFLMVDGSVRFIKDGIAPDVLKALSTPAGGERVAVDQD
jgi:prepilin-type processing-associated H-X9-DG protein